MGYIKRIPLLRRYVNVIDPLSINYVQADNDTTIMILRRFIYNHQLDLCVKFNKSNIVSIHPVDDVSEDYYYASLNYNRDFIDDLTNQTIVDSIELIKKRYDDSSAEIRGSNTLQ